MNDDTDDDTRNTTQNDAKPPEREKKKKKKTRYILGEFNCSCVGLTKFRAACGPDKDMSDVSDQDYFDGAELCDLIGKRCKLRLDEHKEGLKRKKMVQRIVWGTFSLLASLRWSLGRRSTHSSVFCISRKKVGEVVVLSQVERRNVSSCTQMISMVPTKCKNMKLLLVVAARG